MIREAGHDRVATLQEELQARMARLGLNFKGGGTWRGGSCEEHLISDGGTVKVYAAEARTAASPVIVRPRAGDRFLRNIAIRLPLTYDAERLRSDLEATRPFERVPQFGVYHNGEWTGISLCAEGGDPFTTRTGIVPTGQPFAYTEVLQRTPYFRELLDELRCPKRSVRLLHLPPGGRIERHSDPPLNFQHGILRLHLPIVTHPDVVFVIGEQRCVWRAGELWWGNFARPHSVYNGSPIERVHMVLDVEITDFVLDLFPEAFRRTQADGGISMHRAPITLSAEELAGFSCEVQIPAGTLPLPGLERGTLARIHVDGQDLVMFLPDRPLFRLQPVAPAEFRVVGWSSGVTIRFALNGERVSEVELVIRGLPRTFLGEESADNPRLPVRTIPLQIRAT